MQPDLDLAAAARATLPAWVVWGPLARQALGSFALGFLVTRALCWRYLRNPPTGHWSERARVLHTTRVGIAMGGLSFAFFAGALAWMGTGETGGISRFSAAGLGGAATAAALLGSTLGSRRFSRSWRPPIPLSSGLRSWAFQLLGRFPSLLLGLTGAIVLPPRDWSAGSWALAAALFVAIGLASFGGGFWLLRAVGILEPAGAKLRAAVAQASGLVGITPRDALEIRTSWLNLWALPTLQYLVASRRAVELVDDDQLAAIVCHELGHLGESKGTVTRRVLGGACFAWLLLLVQPLVGWLGPAGLLVALFGWSALTLALGRMGRDLEKHADEVASAHWKATYAKALERLYEENHYPAVMPRRGGRSRGTHPDLYDRMVAAGVTPDFPRPEPPERRGRRFWLILAAAWILDGALCFVPPAVLAIERPGDPIAALAVLAWTGGSRAEIWNAGRLAEVNGDPLRARALTALAGYPARSTMKDPPGGEPAEPDEGD